VGRNARQPGLRINIPFGIFSERDNMDMVISIGTVLVTVFGVLYMPTRR